MRVFPDAGSPERSSGITGRALILIWWGGGVEYAIKWHLVEQQGKLFQAPRLKVSNSIKTQIISAT